MNSFSYYDASVLSLGALILGIILLIKGGNLTIDSAIFVAKRFGLSPLVVGFTIVAFGTSLPELIVSVIANLQGSPGIALGNVLGSNIANILLVLGFTAIIVPISVNVTKPLLRDLAFMILATLALIGLLMHGEIPRFAGFGMIFILLMYVMVQYFAARRDPHDHSDMESLHYDTDVLAYTTLFVGLITIAVGAEFLVKGAKASAELIGVPESVIALSVIAFGTSLPELSTSIIGAKKKQAGLVIGNIVGSCVFNILMIIGAAAIAKPIVSTSFSPQILDFDVWVTLGVAVSLVIVLLLFKGINRVFGSLFFAGYIGYNIYIYMANLAL